MLNILFAAESGKSVGLFGALGIDWKALIINALAFLVLVGFLAKFILPALIRSIDERRETIEKGLEEAKQSQEASAQAEKRISQMLASARKEADEIIARSHAEAQAQVSEAEQKARSRSEQIVKDAHTQIGADIAKARVALKKDTAALVALATERVIHEKVDAKKDSQLIDRALSQAANVSEERA